ncbi:MAG: Asp-tRNA(Asn)/Glu-tRNA(Gln) amidotransferase subunit GatC [Kiritimatiellae bacterium]|nr:Asp-tRNA(Asn)/Glu-tRNA(Gln) amidotransferase subunit GatC [Kiritimatiellia bacterium]
MSKDDTNAAGRIDVGYVAHLARLRLDGEETATFQAQLDGILAYVNQLRELDVEGIEPTAHATLVQNVFRKDSARPGLDREKVLANAPRHGDGQFLVPRILD